MRALRLLAVTLTALTFYAGCKKESMPVQDNDVQQKPNNLLEAARTAFAALPAQPATPGKELISQRANLRLEGASSPLWDKARILTLSGQPVVEVPLRYEDTFYVSSRSNPGKFYNFSALAKLRAYQDAAGNFHFERVTYYPDSSYRGPGNPFRGIASIEDLQGNTLKRFLYTSSGILRYDPAHARPRNQMMIEICYYTTYSVNAAGDPGNAYTWTEFLGCSSTYLSDMMPGDGGGGGSGGGSGYGGGMDYGGGGGGGGTGDANQDIPSSPYITFYSAPSRVANVPDYLKCYTNGAGSGYNYSVSVMVDPPSAGSREPWAFGPNNTSNPFMVGHTYLMLTETTGATTINRNIGFYPSTSVYPGNETSLGQFGNDYNRNVSVQVNIPLDNSTFFNLLNYINNASSSGMIFDLNNNNCTTFTLNALASVGINLPRTTGSWPMGGGLDPGDLGEDLRSMSLPRGWSRNTSYLAHPNLGTCY